MTYRIDHEISELQDEKRRIYYWYWDMYFKRYGGFTPRGELVPDSEIDAMVKADLGYMKQLGVIDAKIKVLFIMGKVVFDGKFVRIEHDRRNE